MKTPDQELEELVATHGIPEAPKEVPGWRRPFFAKHRIRLA